MQPSFLKSISSGTQILLGATDGTRTIVHAINVFTDYIDADFQSWGLDVPSQSTVPTPVEVHELANDGSFQSIFGSLSLSLDRLCFTQDQIIEFVERHSGWLHPQAYGTFFLLKREHECFVADVYRHADGRCGAYVYRVSDDYVWSAEYRNRFVLPLR